MVPISTCLVKPATYNPGMSTAEHGFSEKLAAWQRLHGRHDLPWQGTRDPYRIWVSEIMLQQTQVAAVVGYYGRFMDRFPDVSTLAAASEEDVLRLWSGLGYYARARNLQKAARTIAEKHGGRFPETAEEIESLPGIGRSTAAAIAAFAFGERVAILDGNVKRVLARRFGIEGFPGSTKVEKVMWELADTLLPASESGLMERYTQGLMDLGATVCTRGKPACGRCPIQADCVAFVTGRVSELPAPRPKKAYPTRQARWIVMRHANDILLERRASSGIWGGLWAFPELSDQDLQTYCRAEYGCVLSQSLALPSFSHGFTHFRLEISPVLCSVERREPRAESSDRTWMHIEEAMVAAVPVPVRKVLSAL
jgi:A/G-specific adenine glycosylase